MRADTLASVARRIYQQEAGGAVGHAAVRRIARVHALLAALDRGSPAALRAAALRQLFNPGKHVVRLSVVRGGQTQTDVGGAVVVAPAHLRLRGAPGHVESSLATATPSALPASGSATVAGQAYEVRSFHETGFGGELLTVWILSR